MAAALHGLQGLRRTRSRWHLHTGPPRVRWPAAPVQATEQCPVQFGYRSGAKRRDQIAERPNFGELGILQPTLDSTPLHSTSYAQELCRRKLLAARRIVATAPSTHPTVYLAGTAMLKAESTPLRQPRITFRCRNIASASFLDTSGPARTCARQSRVRSACSSFADVTRAAARSRITVESSPLSICAERETTPVCSLLSRFTICFCGAAFTLNPSIAK